MKNGCNFAPIFLLNKKLKGANMAVTFSGKFNTSGRTSIGPTGGAVTTDPYWNNVTFLLNYTNGYADASPAPKALQDQGTTAARSNVGGAFPAGADQWHGVFNGARTSVLQYDNSSNAFNFGTRSFTIDGWINPAVYQSDGVNNTSMVIMSTRQYVYPSYRGGWIIYVDTNTKQLKVNFNDSSEVVTSQIIPLNTWTHFAITRNGTTAKMYINGLLSNTITNLPATMPGVTATYGPNRLRVGSGFTDGILVAPFNGRMDEIRITDGIVRYTDDFTLPTAPYPVTA